MKFEKLSLDKFDSHAMSSESMFKIIGGVATKYVVLTGEHTGGTGEDTRDGLNTKYTTGPLAGRADRVIAIIGVQGAG